MLWGCRDSDYRLSLSRISYICFLLCLSWEILLAKILNTKSDLTLNLLTISSVASELSRFKRRPLCWTLKFLSLILSLLDFDYFLYKAWFLFIVFQVAMNYLRNSTDVYLMVLLSLFSPCFISLFLLPLICMSASVSVVGSSMLQSGMFIVFSLINWVPRFLFYGHTACLWPLWVVCLDFFIVYGSGSTNIAPDWPRLSSL